MTNKKLPTLTRSDVGCWVEGHWGHYGSARVIEIAEAYGYDNQKDIFLAKRYFEDSNHPDCELIIEAADDAETWLNDNIAPEGCSFGWSGGEWFLWLDTDFS